MIYFSNLVKKVNLILYRFMTHKAIFQGLFQLTLIIMASCLWKLVQNYNLPRTNKKKKITGWCACLLHNKCSFCINYCINALIKHNELAPADDTAPRAVSPPDITGYLCSWSTGRLCLKFLCRVDLCLILDFLFLIHASFH